MSETQVVTSFDLADGTLRELNSRLHEATGPASWTISNPNGFHNIAAGLKSDLDVEIQGHAGYYCAGMNQLATVRVRGNAGVGVAENMMSGRVEVFGDASQSAGATAHGGQLIIHGSASARCAISLKGADVVVNGSIGHMGAFMAQSGRLVVCGDAGDALGDSIYEAELFVRGSVASLGADCVERELTAEHIASLKDLLSDANVDADASDFRVYGSARELYTFHPDDAGDYR